LPQLKAFVFFESFLKQYLFNKIGFHICGDPQWPILQGLLARLSQHDFHPKGDWMLG
jgi:hypothetical protein